MREHASKIVILVLMLVVVGTPFALRALGLTDAPEAANDADERLVIYTPHNEQIRDEFAHAFNTWRTQQQLPPVAFDWRASGGTTDLRKTILSQYEARAKNNALDQGIGADLFFGGGEYDHNKITKGVALPDGTRATVAAVPRIPEALFNAAFPQPTIGGERLYQPDRLWTGTALSSFGIVYNLDLLDMLGLDPPTDWADLADPRYANWLAMVDPGHSGSISATIDTVLRRNGWTDGWALLRRVYANSRYFAAAATKVPMDVATAEAAAGMCIDFYGRFQAGAVASTEGSARIGYTDPAINGVSQTATTADPITLLRGAPNREIAEQFITWLLSKDAQNLWQKKVGTPHGPRRYELRRQPIRPDVYTAENKTTWTDPQIDPFTFAHPFPKAMPSFFSSVAPVSHAMAIDLHHELKAAWATINATPDTDPRKADMLRLFDAMPPELTLTWPDDDLAAHWREALDDENHPRHRDAAQTLAGFKATLAARKGDQVLRDRLNWTAFFRDNYEQIVRLGE